MSSKLVFAYLAFAVSGVAFGQDATVPAEAPDCSRWSLKGVVIGETVASVRQKNPNLKHGRNWFWPGDQHGRAWYMWAESRMQGVYVYVLPERDVPDAAIVSITSTIDLSKVSSTQAIDALIERWGTPNVRQSPYKQVSYYRGLGIPAGTFDWMITTWEDESCDVVAIAWERSRPGAGVVGPSRELTVTIDRLSSMKRASEAAKQEAKEAVR